MSEQILILTGFIGFITALFSKYNVWRRLERWGAMEQDSRLVAELMNCRFCLTFHISVIVYGAMCVVTNGNDFNLAVIVVSNGLIHLFKNNGL